MNTCPFFNKCGGCKYDFASDDYRKEKLKLLNNFFQASHAPGGAGFYEACLNKVGLYETHPTYISIIQPPIWIEPGTRRRADFSFAGGKFGFFSSRSKNIIPIDSCPALTFGLNAVLPTVSALPWTGSGEVLLTECANGIDIAITSAVPYFSADFKSAAEKINAIRAPWNGKEIFCRAQPFVDFCGRKVPYPAGAFLQPSLDGENVLRDSVKVGCLSPKGTGDLGTRSPHPSISQLHPRIADLFCGLGTFTFALGADGYDIFAPNHRQRDLSKKPLTARELEKYDCVVMDPPRGGAESQCKQIAKSSVSRVVYVSCNPESFLRDAKVLESCDRHLESLTPVDQFAGTAHWELVGIFAK